MDITNTLLDNSENLKMVDTLRKCISDKDINIIRIATGYWDIPGMALLKDELKEYLDSLIASVVTGQVDVRNIAVEDFDPADLITETDDDPAKDESPEESEE